jgi:hypothetical protein
MLVPGFYVASQCFLFDSHGPPGHYFCIPLSCDASGCCLMFESARLFGLNCWSVSAERIMVFGHVLRGVWFGLVWVQEPRSLQLDSL